MWGESIIHFIIRKIRDKKEISNVTGILLRIRTF